MFESLEGCLKHAISTKKHTCVLARALRHVVIFAILRNIVKRILFTTRHTTIFENIQLFTLCLTADVSGPNVGTKS